MSDGGAADLQRDTVIGWFGDPARFAAIHRLPVDEQAMAALIDEDQE